MPLTKDLTKPETEEIDVNPINQRRSVRLPD